MYWASFIVGVACGIAVAGAVCTWTLCREHREWVSLVDRCIEMNEHLRKRSKE